MDTVICIGAGNSQIPYLKEVKRRGCKLICADKNPESPGFKIADDYVVSSTFDYKNTPKLIMKKLKDKDKVKTVIAPCTGPPFKTAQEVRRILNLPCYPKDKLNILLDKLYLREYSNSIGCSNIEIFNDKNELSINCFPLVKKPRYGGLGGREVEFYLSLNDFIQKNHTLKIDQKFVYERLIYGKEIAIDAIWNGNSIVFFNMGWTLFDSETGIMIGSTSQSDLILDNLELKIKKVIYKFCSSFNLSPEVLNIDMILDLNNLLHIIEVEFVPADAIPLCRKTYKYNMVKNYMSTYLDNKIEIQPKRLKNAAKILSNLQIKSRIESINHTKSKSSLINMEFNPIPPYEIQTKMNKILIDGYYLIIGEDEKEFIKNIQNVFPKICLERINYE